jgi:protocatechuate 3,4-dioxygenase beta subunit
MAPIHDCDIVVNLREGAMNFDERPQLAGLSRRSLMFGAVSAGALAGPAAAQLATNVLLRGTPPLTTGPFYPVLRPLDEDADLTRIRGREGVAKGTIIDVAGRVLTGAGAPVEGAKLDLWQANSYGRYHHPADPARAPLDPAFQGAAVLRTDKDGRFRFRTIVPGPYGSRARHIHFDVTGHRRRLATQMFFPGERNQDDHLYRAIVTQAQKEAATARLAPAPSDSGRPLYIWNVVLVGEPAARG